jgi:hypothetical protein
MKTKIMEIHTCEFCGKYYKMKHHAKRHEKFCRNNPINDHVCFRDCKNLEREKIECRHSDGERVAFICGHYPLYELYSYAAEKSLYLMGEIRTNGCRMMRMPTKCMHFNPCTQPHNHVI